MHFKESFENAFILRQSEKTRKTYYKTCFLDNVNHVWCPLLLNVLSIIEKMKILILFAWISLASITSADFPSFNIQANSSFLASGDTLVIKCLISNITLLDFVNSYSICWFKDDIQITQSYNYVINDARYSVHLDLSAQEQNIVFKLQITSITNEDEGFFACELTDRESVKQRQFVSILVDDYGDSSKGNTADHSTISKIKSKSTSEHIMFTKFDMDNMTYAENINQSRIDAMIGLKNKADFEISTVDTHKSEKTSNYTNIYEETTQNRVETAIRFTQDYTMLVIVLGVSVFAILFITFTTFEVARRRRTQKSSMPCPFNPHQPMQVSTRLLPINQVEAMGIRSKEERTTEEGSRKFQISQSCFNNPGYTLVIVNEQINNANNSDRLSGVMELDRRVVDGDVSFNEETALQAESFGTKDGTEETNARHSRFTHPPYEKWSNSFFEDYT